MNPAEIDAIALRARAEAEAVALRAKAEVDAAALRAVAEADAAAARSRAELEAHALRMGAEADRDEAARVLADARDQVERMLLDAQARIDARVEAQVAAVAAAARVADEAEVSRGGSADPVEVVPEPPVARRSAADRETLDRLQATRIHLHEAIERLAEMSEPVLDLTDGLPGSGDLAVTVPLDGPLLGGDTVDDEPMHDDATVAPSRAGTDASDPVDAFVLAAIERASNSGVGVAEPDLWGGDHPSTRRRELRDGRDLL